MHGTYTRGALAHCNIVQVSQLFNLMSFQGTLSSILNYSEYVACLIVHLLQIDAFVVIGSDRKRQWQKWHRYINTACSETTLKAYTSGNQIFIVMLSTGTGTIYVKEFAGNTNLYCAD